MSWRQRARAGVLLHSPAAVTDTAALRVHNDHGCDTAARLSALLGAGRWTGRARACAVGCDQIHR
ncbi:MAG: hypothetical protein ACRCYQ_05505 [Nocardioides sp.]